jgi:tetratricopeptide (TPR) repeat protein
VITQLWNKSCKAFDIIIITKKQMIKHTLLLLFAFLIFFSGFAQQKENKKVEFDLLFFDAMNERIKNNFDKSNEYFEKCLLIDDHNDVVYFKIAQNHFDKKDYDKAMFFLNKAQTLNNKNKWYQKLFIEIKIKQGVDNKEIIKLINDFKPVAKNKYLIANLFRQMYNNTVKVNYTTPKKTVAQNSISWQNLLQTKKYNELVKKGENQLLENPDDAQLYWFMAKAKFALNHPKEALEYLDMGIDFIQADKPLQKQYYQLYVDIYQSLKQEKKAEKYRKKLKQI